LTRRYARCRSWFDHMATKIGAQAYCCPTTRRSASIIQYFNVNVICEVFFTQLTTSRPGSPCATAEVAKHAAELTQSMIQPCFQVSKYVPVDIALHLSKVGGFHQTLSGVRYTRHIVYTVCEKLLRCSAINHCRAPHYQHNGSQPLVDPAEGGR
jgi:hypothetical protein